MCGSEVGARWVLQTLGGQMAMLILMALFLHVFLGAAADSQSSVAAGGWNSTC